MKISLADKLKELRKTKNVSQEKLAEYLGISYQAVSKWENGITTPDILLLPEIARYYSITVDELLQVEQIDEERYFDECCVRSENLFRDGKRDEIIPLWREAYKKLPNDVRVKEMLMSIYSDSDRVKYQKEIIELGTELYGAKYDALLDSYYKGQAIMQISRTYYENGNKERAKEWVSKAFSIMHSQEMMYMQVEDNEEWLISDFRFANYWYFDKLFYMAMRLREVGINNCGERYVQNVLKTIASIYETVYSDDDMGFETLRNLYNLHMCIAEDEMSLGKDESVVRKHLSRAVECAEKSQFVKAHTLIHPLVYGWEIADSPNDNKQLMRFINKELQMDYYKCFKGERWFSELIHRTETTY